MLDKNNFLLVEEMNKEVTESRYTNTFVELETNFTNRFPAYVMRHKKESLDAFLVLGFPTTKDEEWRFTPILGISKRGLSLLPISDKNADEKTIIVHNHYALTANKIVFVDGVYRPDLSTILEKDGVHISSIQSFLQVEDNRFNSLPNALKEPFSALNTAFFEDGIAVGVKANVQLQYPIIVSQIITSQASHSFLQQRNILMAGAGSQATILFHYDVAPGVEGALNIVSECFIEANAHLELVHDICPKSSLQLINNTFVSQFRDSTFTCNTMVLSGDLVRNNLQVRLEEPNAICFLNGLSVGDEQHLIDNHLEVHHLVPNCISHQLYKNILKDNSRGVFNGKIFVHKDAQKTNAYQSNKNLILSEEAVMNTKPQLEIFADDVKCSHGATIGQLDDNAKFYLMARGISKENATSLLTYAFATDVTEKIKNTEIKNRIEKALQERLGYSFVD